MWDLPEAWAGTIDLVVLNNTLHELPPHRFPELFSGFNRLLVPGSGRVYVVDMQELPAGEPEAIAINWAGAEVEQFLRAGGLETVVTSHTKSVEVFGARIRHTGAPINEAGMLRALDNLLRAKLSTAVGHRQTLDESFYHDAEQLVRWLVLTGTIARIAEELLAVEQRLARPAPGV